MTAPKNLPWRPVASAGCRLALVAAGCLVAVPFSAWASDPVVDVSVVARSGDDAGGGARFATFGRPFANRNGSLAFRAKTSADGDWSGVWKVVSGDPERVAFADGPATRFFHEGSWVENARFGEFGPPLIDRGDLVYFTGKLRPGLGSSDVYYDEGLWVEGDAPGETWLLARESVQCYVGYGTGGEPVFGVPARWTDRISQPLLGADGQVLLTTRMRGELNPADREHTGALHVASRPGSILDATARPLPVMVGGSAVPGAPGAVFYSFDERGSEAGSGRQVVVATAEALGLRGRWAGIRRTGPEAAPVIVCAEGNPLPAPWEGDRFVTFSGAAINRRGDVAFWASGHEVEGVFRVLAGRVEPDPVLIVGGLLPGISGSTVNAIGNPGIDGEGNVVVRASGDTLVGEVCGIWKFPSSGGPVAVARSGTAAPHWESERFHSFSDPSVTGGGHVVVTARFAPPADAGGEPPVSLHQAGCFLYDLDGVLKPVVVTEAGGGVGPAARRVVRGFEVGEPGEGGVFGIAAEYSDGTSALLRVNPLDFNPPPPPGGVEARWLDDRTVELEWQASEDETGIAEYRVFRDGDGVATVDARATGLTVGELTPGTTYRFTVVAVDFAGNVSVAGPATTVALPVPGHEFIVDDGDPGFAPDGSWPAPVATGAYGGRHRTSTSDGSRATWTFDPPVAAAYRVDAFLGFGAYDRVAVYSVDGDAGGVIEHVVDQQYRPDRWFSLGVVRLAPGSAGSVTLTRTGGSPYGTIADAVRWTLLVDDSSPPASPPSLAARWTSATEAVIDWGEADDDFGVAGYRVVVGATEAGTTVDTSLELAGLEVGRSYSVAVYALDFAGGESPPSRAVLQMPSYGPGTVVDDSDDGFSTRGAWYVNVDVSATGGRRQATGETGSVATWQFVPAVTGSYEVGASIGRPPADHSAPYEIAGGGPPITRNFDQTAGVGGWVYLGTHRFSAGVPATVRLFRQADDPVHTMADAVRFRLLVDDVAPPTVPAGFSARWTGASSVDLEWERSTDDGTVEGYVIFRDGREIGRTGGTGFTDRSVEPGRSYIYSVEALDGAGRLSGGSVPVAVELPVRRGSLAVVADNDAAGFTRSQDWWLGDEPGSTGGGSRFSTTVGAWAEWRPVLPVGGAYEVQTNHPVGQFDSRAEFTVNHAEGSDIVEVDQRFEGGGWVSLGVFRFAAGGGGSVGLTVSGADFRPTVADAARFIPLDVAHAVTVSEIVPGLFPGSVVVSLESRWANFDAAGSERVRVEFHSPGRPPITGGGVTVESPSRLRVILPRSLAPSEFGVYDIVVVSPADGTISSAGAAALGPLDEDRDRDGIPTIIELATGGDPDRAAGLGQPAGGLVVSTGSDGRPRFRYRRPAVDPGRGDGGSDGPGLRVGGFHYTIEVSGTPCPWRALSPAAVESIEPVGGGLVEVTVDPGRDTTGDFVGSGLVRLRVGIVVPGG